MSGHSGRALLRYVVVRMFELSYLRGDLLFRVARLINSDRGRFHDDWFYHHNQQQVGDFDPDRACLSVMFSTLWPCEMAQS